MGGTENMEVDKDAEREAPKEVTETNASDGKMLFTVQEAEILTQHSTTALNIEEGVLEEELLDYDQDPLVAGKLAMAELEKKVEQRANKLVKDAATIL
jgi:hypothetical protein